MKFFHFAFDFLAVYNATWQVVWKYSVPFLASPQLTTMQTKFPFYGKWRYLSRYRGTNRVTEALIESIFGLVEKACTAPQVTHTTNCTGGILLIIWSPCNIFDRNSILQWPLMGSPQHNGWKPAGWLKFYFHRASWHSSATLTEVSLCFSLRCRANAKVQLAKAVHGPHSSQINCVLLCTVCV